MKKLPLLLVFLVLAAVSFGQNVDAERVNVRANFTMPLADTLKPALKIGELRTRPQDSSMYRWNGLRWRRSTDVLPTLNDVLLQGNISGLPMTVGQLKVIGLTGSGLRAVYVLADGTVTTSAASIIHGTQGYGLYYAPDGSAYTFPLKWDSTGNLITFERALNFPAGNITTKSFDISSDVDNSKLTGHNIAGTTINPYGVYSATISSKQVLYNLLKNTYAGGPDATHKNGSSGDIFEVSQDSADAFTTYHRTLSGYRTALVAGITNGFGRANEYSIAFSNQQSISTFYGSSQLMGMDSAGRWRKPLYQIANVDSVALKPVVMDVNGNIFRSTGWNPGAGGTGIALTDLHGDAPITYNSGTGHIGADTTTANTGLVTIGYVRNRYLNRVSDTTGLTGWHTTNYNDARYLPNNGSIGDGLFVFGTTTSSITGSPYFKANLTNGGFFMGAQPTAPIYEAGNITAAAQAFVMGSNNAIGIGWSPLTVIGRNNTIVHAVVTSNSDNIVIGLNNTMGQVTSTFNNLSSVVIGAGNQFLNGSTGVIVGNSNTINTNGVIVATTLLGRGLLYTAPVAGFTGVGQYNDATIVNLRFAVGNGVNVGSRSNVYDVDINGNAYLTPGVTANRPTGTGLRAGSYRINVDSGYRIETYDGSAWHAGGGPGGTFTSPLTTNLDLYTRIAGVDARLPGPGHDGMHLNRIGGVLTWTDSLPELNLGANDLNLSGNRVVTGNTGSFSLSLGIASNRFSQFDIYSAGILGLHGMVSLDAEPTIADANYVAPVNQSTFKLPIISANRVFTPPTTANGGLILLQSVNTSAFLWLPSGTNFKKANGTTISQFDNGQTYIFKSDGSNWVQYNSAPADSSVFLTISRFNNTHDTIPTGHYPIGVVGAWNFHTSAGMDSLIDHVTVDGWGIHQFTRNDSAHVYTVDSASAVVGKPWIFARMDTAGFPSTRIPVGNGAGKLTSNTKLTFDQLNLQVNGVSIGQGAVANIGALQLTDPANVVSAGINNSTVIGMGSLNSTTTSGGDLTGLGTAVFHNLTTGIKLVSIGTSALVNATTAHDVVAVGWHSLQLITTGFDDVHVGSSKTGFSFGANSQRNIYIGNDSLLATANILNATYIGHAFNALRNNVAAFAQSNQVLTLGNGGMTTAQYTALGTTATAGDVYYNKDTADYIRYNGTLWSKFGGAASPGGGSALTQNQIGVGSVSNTLTGIATALMSPFGKFVIGSSNVFTAGFANNTNINVFGNTNTIDDFNTGTNIFGGNNRVYANSVVGVNNFINGSNMQLGRPGGGTGTAISNNTLFGSGHFTEYSSSNLIAGLNDTLYTGQAVTMLGENNFLDDNGTQTHGTALIGKGLNYIVPSSNSDAVAYFGQWNLRTIVPTFVIGNGTSYNNPSNLYDVDKLGNMFVKPNTTANRPAGAYLRAGSYRINTDSTYRLEVYDGGVWRPSNQPGGATKQVQLNINGFLVGNANYQVDIPNKAFLATHFGGLSTSVPTVNGFGANVSSVTVNSGSTDVGANVTMVTSGAVSGTLFNLNYGSSFSIKPVALGYASNTTTASAIATTTGGYFIVSALDGAHSIVVGAIAGAGTYVFNIISLGN